MSDTVTMVPDSAASPRERLRNVKQQSARLQAAFIHALTEGDVEAIARKLIEQARDGDNTSARLVLKYGFGQLLSHKETDWTLKAEAANGKKPAAATAPTAEEVMAAIHAKVQEQAALEAEILGLNGAGAAPGSPQARGGAGQGSQPAARAR